LKKELSSQSSAIISSKAGSARMCHIQTSSKQVAKMVCLEQLQQAIVCLFIFLFTGTYSEGKCLLAASKLSLSVIGDACINAIRNLLLGDFCIVLTSLVLEYVKVCLTAQINTVD